MALDTMMLVSATTQTNQRCAHGGESILLGERTDMMNVAASTVMVHRWWNPCQRATTPDDDAGDHQSQGDVPQNTIWPLCRRKYRMMDHSGVLLSY